MFERIKSNPRFFISGVVAAALILLFAAALSRRSAPVVVSDFSGDGGQASDSGLNGRGCVDSDAAEEAGGIYVKGKITYRSGDGRVIEKEDNCDSSGGKLFEWRCFERSLTVAGAETHECPDGCSEGACVKNLDNAVSVSDSDAGAGESTEIQPKSRTTKFSFPYPLSWSEWTYKFDLTAVSFEPERLTFYLKINTGRDAACQEIALRRLIDEEGNLAPPENANGAFLQDEEGKCIAVPNAAFPDQKVVFAIPAAEQELLFTTGGQSNIFFSVTIRGDGTVDVHNISRDSG